MDMDQLPFRTVLDADPRPSLVIDLHDHTQSTKIQPRYVNKSLEQQPALLGFCNEASEEAANLRAWMTTSSTVDSTPTFDAVPGSPHDSLWFAYNVADRWRVVQCLNSRFTAIPFDVTTPPEEKNMSLPSVTPIDPPLTARTAFAISDQAADTIDGLARHLEIIDAFDWASTSLGPISDWPIDLLQIVHLILLDPVPQCLFLGDDHILIYNIAYAEFAGTRHPSIMGSSLFCAWSEAVELNKSTFEFIDSTGRPFIMDDFVISIDRKGFLEELYLKWTTIRLKGDLRGYLCTATEETSNKVNLRRKALLTSISDACRGIRDMSTFWQTVLKTIGTNDRDFPFAFIYSRVLGHEGLYTLEGALDAEDPERVLPATLNLSTDDHILTSPFREAQSRFLPVMISKQDATLPESVMQLSEGRGLGDRCLNGLVCPIRRATDNMTLGVLVIGLNTRKTYVPADQAFVQYMMRSLGDLATNTINAQETDRLAKQTASQHQTLIRALATSTLEATQMTEKFHSILRTMELVDVGIFEFDLTGKLIQANEAFFRISNHPREMDASTFAWRDTIHLEDQEKAEAHWVRVAAGGQANFEFRYRLPPVGAAQVDIDHGIDGYWVQAAVIPVVDQKTGITKSISGCITDIMPSKRGQIEAIKRNEALQKLRESEARFSRFAENALCPIYMYDAERRLKYCNDAYYEMVGYSKDQSIADLEWKDLINEADLPQVATIWQEAIEKKSSLSVTCRLKKTEEQPDGKRAPVWIITSTYPEQDADGNITGWVGVALDISQLKWGEKVQQQRMQEIVEAKQQQESFIDMTSHEIRNPLGAVVHCADSILTSLVDLEALAKDPGSNLPQEQRKQLLEIHESSLDAVNTIVSCSTHQRRIVDDVLTFSKLNSDLLKIMPSAVRPTAILQDVRNMFETDAAKVGVSLSVRNDTTDSSLLNTEWVMLDPGRLMQVLLNLGTNAIKFCREEAVRRVTVTMGMSTSKPSLDRIPVDFVPSSGKRFERGNEADWGSGQDVYLYFLVEDTGCGMSEEEKSKIFARFSQGNPRTHTKYGGSGLGLFISRELVELQEGEIGFASQAGVGSTFGFFIKARAADPSRVGTVTPTLRSGRLSSSGTAISQRFSILVVEDNVVNQAVLSKQLRRLGHEVHVANNGFEALRFLQGTKSWTGKIDTPHQETFPEMQMTGPTESRHRGRLSPSNQGGKVELSVILMDVEMPLMDGLTCATEIRKLQSRGLIESHVPIIAVSANARSEQVSEALACGMDDAICKPFRIVDLMPKIERLAA